jgi:exocyst complex component 2
MQVLRTTADASLSRIRLAMDQYGAADRDDRRQAAALRSCVQSLETYDGERIRGEYGYVQSDSVIPEYCL